MMSASVVYIKLWLRTPVNVRRAGHEHSHNHDEHAHEEHDHGDGDGHGHDHGHDHAVSGPQISTDVWLVNPHTSQRAVGIYYRYP